jgi:hypothetical protein
MNTVRLTLKARRRAERLMHDECEIRRPATLGPLNLDTGERDVIPGDLVYDGRCRAFTYEPFESTPESGQHVFTVQRKQIHIPVDAEGVQVNDEVSITLATLDPSLLGRTYRVAGLHHVTFARDQRLLVEEINA